MLGEVGLVEAHAPAAGAAGGQQQQQQQQQAQRRHGTRGRCKLEATLSKPCSGEGGGEGLVPLGPCVPWLAPPCSAALKPGPPLLPQFRTLG